MKARFKKHLCKRLLLLNRIDRLDIPTLEVDLGGEKNGTAATLKNRKNSTQHLSFDD